MRARGHGCIRNCRWNPGVPESRCRSECNQVHARNTLFGKAVQAEFKKVAKAHLESRYPIVEVKSVGDVAATATTLGQKFANGMGVEDGRVWRVFFLNLTFFGFEALKKVAPYITLLKDKFAAAPERTCALIVATNVGPYKQTYDEAAAEKMRRDIFDLINEQGNGFLVKNVTGLFSRDSLKSKTRRTKHEVSAIVGMSCAIVSVSMRSHCPAVRV